MYQVLARKWRPQTLDDLVGQAHVSRTLRNALEARRWAHAYIFAGVRGTGKTTVARILAKCLNCESGPASRPCNCCVSCREITEGSSIDVLELDAASRTGIDDIREMQEMVAYAPVRDRFKILIIDEAHMLSKAAFNALLKTLEEPPEGVLFILATTELHKLLPTILSRCQLFEFRRVPVREVSAHLRAICSAEGIEVSEKILDRIARAGDGSVRDALSILERVRALTGSRVDDEQALALLGAVRTEVLVSTIAGLAARDAGSMLQTLDALIDEGHDLVHFWSELLGALRDLLLRRSVPDRIDLLDRSEEETLALESASSGLSLEDLARAFQIVADLEAPLRASSQARFLFEAALIRLASLGSVRPIEDWISALGLDGSLPRTAPRSNAPEKKNAPEREPPRDVSHPVARPSVGEPAADAGPRSGPPGGGELEALVRAVHHAKPLLGAMLEQAESMTIDGDNWVVGLSPGSEPIRRILEREDSLALLRACALQILGRPLRVHLKEAAPPPENRSLAARPAPGAGDAPPLGAERPDLVERARRDPGIEKLLEVFGAQVVDVHPLEGPLEPAPDDDGSERGDEESA